MIPHPSSYNYKWQGVFRSPVPNLWRHGALQVTVHDVPSSDVHRVSVAAGSLPCHPPTDEQLDLVRRDFGLGDAEVEESITGGLRYLVLPKLPESYPWNTTGVVFHRDSPKAPWRVHSLFTGDAKGYQVHDAGWNSDSKSNLYADVGGGGGLPYLHEIGDNAKHNGDEAVWSRHGWCSGDKLGKEPVDAEAFGHLVLGTLPDITLEECGTLQWCEVCEEQQDFSNVGSSCEHVWWCRTANERCGATGDDHTPPPCTDEYCECDGRTATQKLYAVPLIRAHGRPW